MEIMTKTKAITDQSGNIVERYSYDPFGKVAIQDASGNTISESQIGNPYYYTGQTLDPETGLYNYRNRYYSPDLGRFVSRDPLGYIDGMNLYTYVSNNPVNYTDTYGLLAAPWHFGITYFSGVVSGYGIVNSLKTAWESTIVDFEYFNPGTQGRDWEATRQHGMAGIIGSGEYQNSNEAIASAKNYIQTSINNGNMGGAIHSAQDLATPAHSGHQWNGFHLDMETVNHIVGDVIPSLNTIEQAYKETGRLLDDVYQDEASVAKIISSEEVVEQALQSTDLSASVGWNQLIEAINVDIGGSDFNKNCEPKKSGCL